MEDWYHFYVEQSITSDPGEYTQLFHDLPDDVPSLCKIVQNVIIHSEDIGRYGIEISEDRIEEESNLRKVSRQLNYLFKMIDAPLSATRLPQNKVVGNCRDFSFFMSGLLRYKGIPVRVRVGFCTYLKPGEYTNHFVCQYWYADDKRWVWVDAMIDDILRNGYNINFNTLDMPEGLFLPAGDCWQMCRSGEADPSLFWYFKELRGTAFILGNLVRDLASLNKVEVLAWDRMDIMPDNESKEIPLEDTDLIDRIASVIKGNNPDFKQLRSVYENENRLHLPDFVEDYIDRI